MDENEAEETEEDGLKDEGVEANTEEQMQKIMIVMVKKNCIELLFRGISSQDLSCFNHTFN